MPDKGGEVEEVNKEIQQDYQKTVEKESKDLMDTEAKDTADEINRIAGLGFASKNDVTQNSTEVLKRLAKIEKDWTQLREFLLRKKAQGKATIPAEEKKSEADELKDIYLDVGQFE